MGGLRSAIASALAFAALVATAPPAYAGEALSISPAFKEVSTAPGLASEHVVTVVNLSDVPVSVIVRRVDLDADPRGRFLARPVGSRPNSAALWLTVELGIFELPGGHSRPLKITVTPPAGAQPGGYYAGVHLHATGSSLEESEAVHAVLVGVPGPAAPRSGRVVGLSMPEWSLGGSVPLTLTLENTGALHLIAEGTILLRNALGRVAARVQIGRAVVLPGKRRVIVTSAATPLLPGPLYARADIGFGPGVPGGAASAQGFASTWPALAGAGLVVLLALRFAVRRIRRRVRSRRERRERAAHAERAAPVAHAERAARSEPEAGPQAVRGTRPASAEPTPATAPAAGAPGREALWAEPERAIPSGIAVRRGTVALDLLARGPGRRGVRLQVALDLLGSVRTDPEVARLVEDAYLDARRRSNRRALGPLALALALVESTKAPEGLLRAYASAGRALVEPLRAALRACDPADLRAHGALLRALPEDRLASLRLI